MASVPVRSAKEEPLLGPPDFLKAAALVSEENEAGPAVFGVLNGSWCPELAARIPDGARIFAATHDDLAGEEYAEKVAATLRDRCAIFRFHPSGEVAEDPA